MTRISAAAALLIALAGCKDKMRETPATPPAKAVTQLTKAAEADPLPKPVAEPAISDRESITVSGAPACAMTIAYPGQIDQPVTWTGEDCARITVAIADVAQLKSLGKWEKLSDETRDDIARTRGRVLYIEGTATASLYPLNVVGRIYDVPVAD